METIEDVTTTTKVDNVLVVTSTQLLETCREEGMGLIPHGIGPFSIGGGENLVIIHCVPLRDLKKVFR